MPSCDSFSFFHPKEGAMSAKRRCRFRPSLEVLEDRCLLSTTFTVTNLKDDGSPGCLRSRGIAANMQPGADAVVFKPGLEGAVHLNGSEIPITDSLLLQGPGAGKIALNGNFVTRIFNINGGAAGADLNVTIQGLELLHGETDF